MAKMARDTDIEKKTKENKSEAENTNERISQKSFQNVKIEIIENVYTKYEKGNDFYKWFKFGDSYTWLIW